MAMSKRSASKGFAPIIILVGILVLAGIAGGIFYATKLNTSETQKVAPVSKETADLAQYEVRIKSITYDKDCSVKIEKEGSDLDFFIVTVSAIKKECTIVYPPQISSDGKYGAFEMRMVQAELDGKIWANNSIFAYFADHLVEVIVDQFGAAIVKEMSFDKDNNLLVQLSYEGKDVAGVTKYLLPKINEKFDQVVTSEGKVHYTKDFPIRDVIIHQ